VNSLKEAVALANLHKPASDAAASKEDGVDYSNKLANQVLAAWKDQMPGGLADKKNPSDFDQTQLAKGKKVEIEHTTDPLRAEEIAMDHLTEDPDYYKKLERMEKEGRAWRKGYTEGHPGAVNAAKTVLSNLLAMLRALQWNHLTSHWQSRGDSSYGDHLLFERLYNKVVEETDGLAEKLVGTFGVAAVDAREQAKLMAFTLHKMGDIGCPFERGLHFERALQVNLKDCLDAMEDIGQLSLGMDDFLRTMANDHETHIYLLQQRQGGVKMASATASKKLADRRRARAFTVKCILRAAAQDITRIVPRPR
jgi:DNA-binding ferritin-like protein